MTSLKRTAGIMGMPVTVEIVDCKDAKAAISDVFDYFRAVDERYSTYKPTSEISHINRGLPKAEWSDEMRQILELCEQTRRETGGFFDIQKSCKLDPSGLVKGWAIQQAAEQLRQRGIVNFYIDAGGDIQTNGVSAHGRPWRVGIRNPFDTREIVKTVAVGAHGVATSGTYIRGQHIYDPHHPEQTLDTVKSITVIGPDIYDADRFATAAFAMGAQGIDFIESLPEFEAYMIDTNKIATFTSGFERYVANV